MPESSQILGVQWGKDLTPFSIAGGGGGEGAVNE